MVYYHNRKRNLNVQVFTLFHNAVCETKKNHQNCQLANLKLLSILFALGPRSLVPQQDVDFLLDPVLVVWCVREGLLLVPAI